METGQIIDIKQDRLKNTSKKGVCGGKKDLSILKRYHSHWDSGIRGFLALETNSFFRWPDHAFVLIPQSTSGGTQFLVLSAVENVLVMRIREQAWYNIYTVKRSYGTGGIHKDGDGDASIPAGVGFIYHRTSANFDINDNSSEIKLWGRLLESFQDDAKYEHVGQDTRSQGGKDVKDKQG
ncbi:hypothetical protein Tco_0594930 [Tanacetum coccineum]